MRSLARVLARVVVYPRAGKKPCYLRDTIPVARKQFREVFGFVLRCRARVRYGLAASCIAELVLCVR